MTTSYSAKSLEPAPSAVPNRRRQATYDDNDQKSCGVHIVLLLGDKRGPRGQGIPKDQKGPAPTPAMPLGDELGGGVQTVPRIFMPKGRSNP